MQKAALRIVKKLRRHGHEAFFAGGWVRDHLLRRKSRDIDIATSARPDEVRRLFPGSRAIGVQFGVVQVLMYGRPYDVATFRTEESYADGRHPTRVNYSGPRLDAMRRDFTVNGLFYDPLADRIIDYIHGLADLRRKILRTIGDPKARFSEDKLRMLRAVRLASDLDFTIAPSTYDAIGRLAPEILQVSWERIRDEIVKILTGPRPGYGLRLLLQSGLLRQILPEVDAMSGIPQPEEFHPLGDVFEHTCAALDRLRRPGSTLALAALLHDVGKPPTFAVKERIRFDDHARVGAEIADVVCRRLRLSKDDREHVVDLVANHMRFMQIRNMKAGTLRRFLNRPAFRDHLELHRADCLASHGKLDNLRFAEKKLKELESEPRPMPKLVSGYDLIEMGYRPGPGFREILQMVEDLQAEGVIHSREEALEHIRRTFPTVHSSEGE